MSTRLYRWVWVTDTHTGQPGRYGVGEPEATVAYINSLEPEFVINTGDVVNDCTVTSQFDSYISLFANALDCPLYNIPGNHDGQSGNHTNYIAALGPIHFPSFSFGRFRFIGIVPIEAADMHATISAAELDYLETELLQVGAEEMALVFSHYPVIADFSADHNITTGSADLLTLLQTYSVKAFFSGHIHYPTEGIMQDGTMHINGDALVPYINSSLNCGMMICNVYCDHLSIDYVRGADPWDSFSTSGAMAGLNDITPYYYPVDPRYPAQDCPRRPATRLHVIAANEDA